MSIKETVVIGETEREVADFLQKLRAAGKLRVQLGKDIFFVKISGEVVSEQGRAFLVSGGSTDR